MPAATAKQSNHEMVRRSGSPCLGWCGGMDGPPLVEQQRQARRRQPLTHAGPHHTMGLACAHACMHNAPGAGRQGPTVIQTYAGPHPHANLRTLAPGVG